MPNLDRDLNKQILDVRVTKGFQVHFCRRQNSTAHKEYQTTAKKRDLEWLQERRENGGQFSGLILMIYRPRLPGRQTDRQIPRWILSREQFARYRTAT